jgi:hypothetical protein
LPGRYAPVGIHIRRGFSDGLLCRCSRADPLCNIYRADEGSTNFRISMAIVSYSVGSISGLLVL